jgi:hypothetical protein
MGRQHGCVRPQDMAKTRLLKIRPKFLAGELPEESEQFRFFRAPRLANLKGSVGFMSPKTSTIRVALPIDLSTLSFIPLPRFFNSRRSPPLLNPSLLFFPQQPA